MAIAQHRHPIDERRDFFEAVTDVNDPNARLC
jgi:hypothetical protein